MDEIRSLPLTALKESPFNPRKSYPEAELQELAESIRSQGLMQPIVVRIQPEELNKVGHFEYEIIFGHRRARAAAIAELDAIPAIVRVMTDEQAAIAQVHENMKRKDVTALEEADSYVHLRDVHHMRGADIAAAVGKTVSYVYARLKLAGAAPEVRAAVTTRNLSPEIALLIGRLPHHDLQRTALKEVRADAHMQRDGEPEVWISYRDAKIVLRQLFKHDTATAQFDPSDLTLSEIAGACTSCPGLAANIQGLSDVVSPSICTRAACFEAKVVTFSTRRSIELREAGHRVIEGDDARKIMPYPTHVSGMRLLSHSSGVMHEDPREGPLTFEELLKLEQSPSIMPTVIISPFDGSLVQAVTYDEATTLVKIARGGPNEDEGADDDDSTDEALLALPPEQRPFFDQEARRAIKSRVMLAATITDRVADDLRLVLLALADWSDADFGTAGQVMGLSERCEKAAEESANPNTFDEVEWYEAWINTEATADQLALLLTLWGLDFAITGYQYLPNNPNGIAQAARMAAIARRFGVNPLDPDALHGGADASSRSPTPSPAARGSKNAKAKGKSKASKTLASAGGEDAAATEDESQCVEAGAAGDERDPNTSDMFEGVRA